MTKAKYLIAIILLIGVLFLIPNFSNAATEYTYSDTVQGIEWSYKLDNGNNVVNLRCKTTSVIGEVTIPSTIDGKTVISLGEDSYNQGGFCDCSGLTGIKIPDTITKIGYRAFQNCTGLKSVTIPNSVTYIGNNAFYQCTGLTSVTLSNKLTYIGNEAFYGCSGLRSITIPDSVTTIDRGAFKKCSGLKELNLSKNLTTIKEETFEVCSGLKSVILPDSVTTIEGSWSSMYGAFGDCKNLEKILIPDSVSSIGIGAFQGCDKLTIYGNDGMTSKEFAEEKQIKFDYIANWNKASSGTDVTPPTVEKIQVTYQSVLNYNKDSNKNLFMVPAEAKLVINAIFNENVDGTTTPTLTIKFGDGNNIELKNGIAGGTKVTYTYTIKSTDKGIMKTVGFAGGDIKDEAGNAATLSCPALSIEYSSGDFVYANGTATNPDNGGNNNSNNNNSSNNNNGTNNNKPTNNNTTTNKKDNTTATGKLPQTGIGVGLISTIIISLGVAVFVYFKYRNLRGI